MFSSKKYKKSNAKVTLHVISGNKCSYLQIDPKDKEKVNTSMNRTLHEPFRKKELFRIVEENQEMLKRIKEKKSAYNVRQMEK